MPGHVLVLRAGEQQQVLGAGAKLQLLPGHGPEGTDGHHRVSATGREGGSGMCFFGLRILRIVFLLLATFLDAGLLHFYLYF